MIKRPWHNILSSKCAMSRGPSSHLFSNTGITSYKWIEVSFQFVWVWCKSHQDNSYEEMVLSALTKHSKYVHVDCKRKYPVFFRINALVTPFNIKGNLKASNKLSVMKAPGIPQTVRVPAGSSHCLWASSSQGNVLHDFMQKSNQTDICE